MGMSIQAVVYAGICVWVAVPPPAFSQSSPQSKSVPSKQQQIESHSRQAQGYLRKGHPDLAVGEFNAILQLDANNVGARGKRGVMRFFHGHYAMPSVNPLTPLTL